MRRSPVEDLSRYRFIERAPGVEDYNRVRAAAGLGVKPESAVRRGLANTLYGVCVEYGGEIIGFGRIIGDGGLFYEVVDVAVLPEHQGTGLGAGIMDRLMVYLRENASAGAFVSLHAGSGVSGLYERYGFAVRPPETPGMSQVL